MLKADLHIHTQYSMDCNTPLEKIISKCQELGINCIVIADHGTVEGALEMKKIAPFPVIVGEEILTTQGEIMGMFLTETIPSGLTPQETVKRIRAQGGLVNIPHPFEKIRGSSLKEWALEEIAEEIDLMEVLNSRSPMPANSEKAKAFAEKYGITGGAGSDAHTTYEIGNAYVEMPEFKGKEDFLQTLAKGKITGHRTNPLTHFSSAWEKLKNHNRR